MTLIDAYRGVVCDLDGVVYAGPAAIEFAVDALAKVRERGLPVIYATNNASRPPADVAKHLRSFGLQVDDGDVINSSMAGAHVLTQRLKAGAHVLAVGGDGVKLALEAAGLSVVLPDDAVSTKSAPEAVLQGYGPDIRAKDLAEAAYAIQSGATWVATNTDKTLPTDRGIAPGNGSLIAAVRMAVAGDPLVVGKPEPVMYVMASERMQIDAHKVLAIGDRLETDIEGAVKAGMDSVLVLTGVHGFADAAAAPPALRPTYVLEDLRALECTYEVGSPGDWDASGVLFDGPASNIQERRGCLIECWRRVDAGELDPEQAYQAMKVLQ